MINLTLLNVLEFSFTVGLLASILHVISGPDHLAAVLPFAIESKKKAWKIGLAWGIGHLLGMMSIGLLFMLFKEIIPIEKISEYSEQLVGLVLIGIGVSAIYKIFRKQETHKHLHIHSENNPIIHKHMHNHMHNSTHEHKHPKSITQTYTASLSIGILHGFAGIAHFLIFLPLLAFESKIDSILYIVGFALGIVLAMTVFALVIGKIASFKKSGHNDLFFNGMRLAGGLFAIIIGAYWLVKF